MNTKNVFILLSTLLFAASLSAMTTRQEQIKRLSSSFLNEKKILTAQLLEPGFSNHNITDKTLKDSIVEQLCELESQYFEEEMNKLLTDEQINALLEIYTNAKFKSALDTIAKINANILISKRAEIENMANLFLEGAKAEQASLNSKQQKKDAKSDEKEEKSKK